MTMDDTNYCLHNFALRALLHVCVHAVCRAVFISMCMLFRACVRFSHDIFTFHLVTLSATMKNINRRECDMKSDATQNHFSIHHPPPPLAPSLSQMPKPHSDKKLYDSGLS